MTHEELLAKIKGSSPHWKALRAVVELHKPFHHNTTIRCKECSQLRQEADPIIEYPCPTIQAIERELNLTE